MWSIYKHIFPNGKIYIGLTKQEPEQRFKNGYGYESCPLMFNAIQKYGWHSIITEWLEINLPSLQEACELEKHYISLYKSSDREYGYNLANGGQGGSTNKYNHEEIYHYWCENYNITEISIKVGCSSQTVRRVLDKYRVPSEERIRRQNLKEGKKVYKYDYDEIVALWLTGLSTVQVCDKIGCSRGTVQLALNKANISLEEREKRRKKSAAASLSRR